MKKARLLALLFPLAACAPDSDPATEPEAVQQEPAAQEPAAEAASEDSEAATLAKLEHISAAASADGIPFGVSFTPTDFLESYKSRLKELSGVRAPYDAKWAGLPEPEIIPFLEEEKHKAGNARWTDSGGVHSGDYLPRDGSNVTEAWSRVYGFRDLSSPGMIMVENGVPADKWRRSIWQPSKKRWGFFSEEQERSILSAMVFGPLSQLKPDDKNAARFECERMQRAVIDARAKGRSVEGYQRNMRGAIIGSYDGELKHLAGQSLIQAP